MPKKAISVTLRRDNLLWLHGQAQAFRGSSISQVLDRLVSEARSGGRVHEDSIRSVVGTIRIGEVDPGLSGADSAIRSLFPGRGAAVRLRRVSRGRGARRG